MNKLFIALCLAWAGAAAAQNAAISADALAQEYARDGYAAQSRYAGKLITISGTIESRDTSSHGTPRVILVSGVTLTLADDQSNNLDLLHEGELIVANCTVGDGPLLPVLSACELAGSTEPHRVIHRVY